MPKLKQTDREKLLDLRAWLLEHGAKVDDTVFFGQYIYVSIGDGYLSINDIANDIPNDIIMYRERICLFTNYPNLKDFNLNKFIKSVKKRILEGEKK